ncbi:glycosyltransferase [Glutamicibacter sp. X7]
MHVTAIVAAHDGADYLPRTLAALRNQTRPIERFVGVDAASQDSSFETLKVNLPSNAALLHAPKHSLGRSVAEAVEALPAAREDRDEWLWIIHDDSTPATDALEHLTRTVEASESVSIAGCKLLDIDNPRRLVEVGLVVDRRAQRLTMVDTDEVDQGQYDARSDYFAVSSAGMFIRREVFEELGGFDPALPGRGDDVDLSWRNRLAGHRVVVVPEAKMYHHADVVESMAGPREARRAEVFMRLKYAAPAALPLLWIGILAGSLVHFMGALLAKDPGHAFSHLGATLRGLFSPLKLAASRRQVRSSKQIPRRQVRKLMATGAQVREYRRNLATGRTEQDVYGDGSGAAGPMEPSGDNFGDYASLARPPRTSAVLSLLLALALLVGVSLVGWRSILGASALDGGAMRPLSTSLSQLVANAFSWWQPLGTGLGAAPDSADSMYLLLGLISVNHANQAMVILYLAMIPLAGFTAWWGIGALSRSRALRFVVALLWGLQPSLFAALNSGRLGAAAIHVLLPLFLMALLRAMNAQVPVEGTVEREATEQRKSAWTASACAALLLFAISTGSLPFFLTLVVLVYLLALLAPRRAKTLWWVPLPALLWNLPVLLDAIETPRVLLGEPGAPLAYDPAPLWQMLLGFPQAFDIAGAPVGFGWLPQGPWALVAALLVGAPVLLLACAGTIGAGFSSNFASRRNPRLLMWAAALSLLAGWGLGRLPAALDSDQAVTAYAGPFISLAVLALIGAAATSVAAVRQEQLARPARRLAPRSLLGAITALAVISVLAAGTISMAGQLFTAQDDRSVALAGTRQVGPSVARTVPATAADAGRSAAAERTLVLTRRSNGDIDSQLVSGDGQSLDSLSIVSQARQLTGPLWAPERNNDSATEQAQREAVAMLLSESALDARELLGDLGVGYVVLNERGEAASATVRVLDSATGLAAVGQTDSGWLWRVGYEDGDGEAGSGFARIIHENGTISVLESSRDKIRNLQLSEASNERTLVLGTAADPRWRASFNGEPLQSVSYPEDSQNRWAQAWKVPVEAGQLSVRYEQPLAIPAIVLGAVVLLITVLLAIPVPSNRRLVSYRTGEYRFRGKSKDASETTETTSEEPEVLPETVPAATAAPRPALSRREARERAHRVREDLNPKLSDRISDSDAEQEKK